jgi:hypothetical protein
MRQTKKQRLLVIEAIKEAADNVGGQLKLAKKLGCKSQGAISYMIKVGEVPPYQVLPMEKVGRVSRHRLSPVIYPRDGGYESA